MPKKTILAKMIDKALENSAIRDDELDELCALPKIHRESKAIKKRRSKNERLDSCTP